MERMELEYLLTFQILAVIIICFCNKMSIGVFGEKL